MATVEDEIADQLGKEIAEEIDFGIMSTLLVSNGWHKVELDTNSDSQTTKMRNWAEEQGVVQRGLLQRGKTWLFKSRDDAILFRLSWS